MAMVKEAYRCLATAVIQRAIKDGDVNWFTNPHSAFAFYLDLANHCITRTKAIELAKINAEKNLGKKFSKDYAPFRWCEE